MPDKVAIIGSGLIGRSWAMLFASAGYGVSLYDIDTEQVPKALNFILQQMKFLEEKNILKGSETAAVQHQRIKGCTSLTECVEGAFFIQENVPEDLNTKTQIFKELDQIVSEEAVLSSSTSCIAPSKFTEHLAHRQNCIVSHPTNPPYLVPFVEVIPSPWTSQATISTTLEVLKKIGQKPVLCKKETDQFPSCRMQYAILNECVNMVNDGICSVEDVDTIMRDGFAHRYLWMGPLETAHLNAEGIESYVERYGPTIQRVSETLKGPPQWTKEGMAQVVRELNQTVPLDTLQERRAWRDKRLVEVKLLKAKMEGNQS